VKWTSRILIFAVVLAAMGGCQKGQKAEVSKERKSGTSAKAASAGGKSGSKSTKSTAVTAKAGSTGDKSGSKLVRPGTLSMDDNGRSFDVKRGEVIVVRLDANHSVGSSWALTEGIGAILKQEGSAGYVRNTSKTGKVVSGGTETWRFRAVGLGRETVKLQYGRKWETIPERTYRFTVTVR
jgi:predicted secreted protein